VTLHSFARLGDCQPKPVLHVPSQPVLSKTNERIDAATLCMESSHNLVGSGHSILQHPGTSVILYAQGNFNTP
jgi:hypothetical protein